MAIINPPAWQEAGVYTAKMDRQVLSGIIGAPGITSANAYRITQTTPSPTMNVVVEAGSAYVQGTDQVGQGIYHVFNEDSFVLNITASDTNNSRIDLIYIKIYDSEISGTQNMATIEILQGTPSSSPVSPALPTSALPLARVLVPANANAIVSGNITDIRPVARFQTQLTRQFTPKPTPWKNLTDENLWAPNWKEYDAPLGVFQRPAYRKFAGSVELKGLAMSISAIASGQLQTMFTLPVGFRPPTQLIVKTIMSGATTTTGGATAGTAHTHVYGFGNKTIPLYFYENGEVKIHTGDASGSYVFTVAAGRWLTLTGISFPTTL